MFGWMSVSKSWFKGLQSKNASRRNKLGVWTQLGFEIIFCVTIETEEAHSQILCYLYLFIGHVEKSSILFAAQLIVFQCRTLFEKYKFGLSD
jgi:hypothetical protein